MDEFQGLAIKRAVEKLFSDDHFSICEVDTIAKISGSKVNRKIYNQLRAYHCAHYCDMTNREKQLIQEKVVECLRGDPILNPARVLSQLTDEGQDFTFTEDRFIDSPLKRLN